jgi:hypothetical protein
MDRLLLYVRLKKRNVAAKRGRARQNAALAICRVAQRIVMKFPWIMLLTALAAGCAKQAELPLKSEANVARETASSARKGNVAELRHFYLLSPGPNETMVVTRSDLAEH